MVLRRSRLVSLGIIAVVAGSTATPAAHADPGALYRGTWDSASFCGETYDASGGWKVTVKGDTASVNINMALDGKHHASWGYNGFSVVPGSTTFDLRAGTSRFVLEGTELTFTIEDYPCPDGSTDTAVARGGLTP